MAGNGQDSSPFAIPADEEIFRFREEEKARKEHSKLIAATVGVADKTTFAAQMQAVATADTRTLLRELRPAKGTNPAGTLAASSVGTLDRRKEKENMSDFIAKKREIFLLQMSLDTKRAEIKKLEERARQREEALKKSEQMLEEDALRFDAFLKENDEKVQEAIKRAETEAKAKQDKVLEIKRLNTATAALRSELNKYEEQLEDCRRYKEFLDCITPPEWFEQQAAKLQMLTNIEMKLEEFLGSAEAMPGEYVEGMEKGREKERRKSDMRPQNAQG
ncbi:Coiled-coil domain-containing protein 37 [Tetrabaena socialis]|uniref:Coiled-coil domain-containing protein 37 n=1 Tax=Tetrabaena socialis TaxID=47790 RepID=A0A2J7ZQD9_9CHLO|nr:Coiled-coil domain-containing protein 37 [Tetrabaena socialis]|eukprot:PNH02485.1 Coiled-coil domain-containing protein 37 [Tetrabaena socialis]